MKCSMKFRYKNRISLAFAVGSAVVLRLDDWRLFVFFGQQINGPAAGVTPQPILIKPSWRDSKMFTSFARVRSCTLCALFALFALLAFALLASPASAIEITFDYIIDASNVPLAGPTEVIRVRGDSVLTIQDSPDGTEPRGIGKIALYDSASLVVLSGQMHGYVNILGDNRVELRGGFLDHDVVGTGNANILIDGDMALWGKFKFTGGVQNYEIRSFFGLPEIAYGLEDTIEMFSSQPNFAYLPSGNREQYAFSYFGTAERYGDVYIYPEFATYPDLADFTWTMHDTIGRPDGDANLDGNVDLADLNVARNAFGQPTFLKYYSSIGGQYDSNGNELLWGDTLPFDGKVDLDDLNRVRNNFGSTTQPVPEPASSILLLLLLATTALPRILGR